VLSGICTRYNLCVNFTFIRPVSRVVGVIGSGLTCGERSEIDVASIYVVTVAGIFKYTRS
jgi:hypothetical protein